MRYMQKSGRAALKPETVIFDLDDTILIGIGEAWKSAAREVFGGEFIDDFYSEVNKRSKTGGIAFLDYLNFVAKTPDEKTQLLSKYKEFEQAFERKRQESVISNGFIEFIELLKNNNVKCILLSARTKNTVMPDLEHFKIKDYFDKIYCKEDTVVEDKRVYKNDPRCLHSVLKKEGLNAIKTWVVGDDIVADLQSAATNSCMAILCGKKNAEQFKELDNQGLLAHHANDFTDVMALYKSEPIFKKTPILSDIQRQEIAEAIKNGKKVVVTVGVFDLFHLGHAALLAQIRHKAADKLNVDYKDIYLVVGVQDQGRAINDKSAIFENEEGRIEAVQDSGFCDVAVSRRGYPTDHFIDALNREITAVKENPEPKSVDLWFTGADQKADTITRAGLVVDSLNPKTSADISFYLKSEDRSTNTLSSTKLRGLIRANQEDIPLHKKLLLARKEVENAGELTDDAVESILDLYNSGLINDESLAKFNLSIEDLYKNYALKDRNESETKMENLEERVKDLRSGLKILKVKLDAAELNTSTLEQGLDLAQMDNDKSRIKEQQKFIEKNKAEIQRLQNESKATESSIKKTEERIRIMKMRTSPEQKPPSSQRPRQKK